MFQRIGMGATIITFAFALSPSPGFAEASSPLNLCISTPDATGIVTALVKSDATTDELKEIVGKTIGVRVIGSDYEITNGRETSSAEIHRAPPEDRGRSACSSLGSTTVVVTNTPSLPGGIFAAYGSAIAFRKSFTWPRGAVNIDDARSEVFLTLYDSYARVTIAAAPKPLTLGCGGEETYRVDIPSLVVRPYEGCVEAHGARGLPRFNELPPPNSSS